MPPFREGPIHVDRRLDEDALYELRKAGHGVRIHIVDASYPIPDGAKTIKFPGTSAEAFGAIVRVIPVADDSASVPNMIAMRPDNEPFGKEGIIDDDSHVTNLADVALMAVAKKLHYEGVGKAEGAEHAPDWTAVERIEREDTIEEGPGFYSRAQESGIQHIFVRTVDNLPFACVSLVVGHSQRTQ